jgi:adenylate kinase
VSTGDILRAEVARDTELGRRVGPILDAGGLVEDELIVEVLEARLRAPDAAGGGLLDGFPRTVAQARAFDALLDRLGHRVDRVVHLEVPEEALVERLLHRAAVEGRHDDTEEVIRRRMREYHAKTEPLLAYYRKGGAAVVDIDGEGTVEEVQARIRSGLEPVRA